MYTHLQRSAYETMLLRRFYNFLLPFKSADPDMIVKKLTTKVARSQGHTK